MANIKRLQQVVRVLENLPRTARVDMWIWANECGTVACAAGWAGQDPWFRRRGFKLDKVRERVTYFGHYGFVAIEEFFDLTEEESGHLFAEDAHNRRDVIRRFRRFIRKQKAAA